MTANLQLFLDLFIKSNKERFKDSPEVVAMLDKLKLEDIVWDKIEENTEIGVGGRVASFHSDVHNFVAHDQAWICADLHDPAILAIDDIKASLDEVKTANAPGLYLYIDGNDDKLAAIIPEGALSDGSALTTIISQVKDVAKYELSDDSFTLNGDTVTVATDCVEGSLTVLEVQPVEEPPQEETPPAQPPVEEETPPAEEETPKA